MRQKTNDEFGHAEGDRVLKTFARTLLDNFRRYDIIARLGGDEFCVFCSGLNKSEVTSITRRINDSLKAEDIKDYSIEFSVGSIE